MAFLLNLVNPTAQGRLADAERTAGFDVAIVLLEYEVGSLAFELSGKGAALFGHLTPRSGEHSRLNGCPVSLDHYKQAVKLAQQSVPTLAKSAPHTLYTLKAEIELVTLGQLIDVYKKMMESNVAEPKWQSFLSGNPFILDMAFGYPVKKIADQPYVGGKNFSGRGGQYSDFLMAAKATGNLALIEIKHPQHDLLGRQYRQTYIPSFELSGSVAQIVSQRGNVQREIDSLARGFKERVHAHAVAAIVIIGRTPEEEDKQKAFEQYRNGLKDVLVVTFDELQIRLESIYQALTPQTPEEPEVIKDEDLPF